MFPVRAFVAFCALSAISSHSSAVVYKVYDLGNQSIFPGARSVAYAVNNAGTVVGSVSIFGFRWTMSDGFRLTTITPTLCMSESYGISPSGMIAGQFRETTSSRGPGYVRRPNGSVVIIPGTVDGNPIKPLGVNDSMQVVGQFSTGLPVPRGFFWSLATGLQDIGSLFPGSQTGAVAINSSGLVAGISGLGDIHDGAFLWSAHGGMVSVPPWPGYHSCGGFALNELGDLLVWSGGDFNVDHTHVRSLDGTVREIPPVFSGNDLIGQSLNNRGDVAGVNILQGGPGRAFVSLFGQPSVLIQDHLDAGSQGWTLLNANSMNDDGWIVGVGNRGGVNHAYLAVAVSQSPNPKKFLKK